jgi:hypothetical protein
MIPSEMDKGEYSVSGIKYQDLIGPNSLISDAGKGLPGCVWNTEAGQNINLFHCPFYFNVNPLPDSEGIIQKRYQIHFDVFFDKRNCTTVNNKLGTCQVIDAECYWKYI